MSDDEVATAPELTPDPTPGPARGSRGRSVLAGVLGALAVVALLVGTVAVWAGRTLFDSQRVASAVDGALQEPEVVTALAVYLTDQIFTVIDIEGAVDEALPDELDRLSGAIVGGARAFVLGRMETLLSRDEVRQVITTLVERSHARFVDLLQGDGLVSGISVVDGEVTINLLPLVGRGLLAAQELGLFDDVQIPTLTADGDPAAQIAELEAAFGRDLSDSAGQLVVYSSDRLAEAEATVESAQRVLVVAKRAILLLLVLAVGFAAASLWLARRRRRAVVVLSLGVVGVMLLSRVLVRRVQDEIPGLFLTPGGRAAIDAMVGDLLGGLQRAITLLVVLGALTAIAGWLLGPSPSAVAARRTAGATGSSARDVATRHRDGVAILAFAFAVAVPVLFGFGLLQVLAAGAFAVAGAYVLINVEAPAESEA